MKFVVTFEDNNDKAHMRQQHMAEHLAFLEANGDRIEAAGPLFDPADNGGAGGLWIVEADDAEAVHALVKSDPFWPTGLRRSYRVLGWRTVFVSGDSVVGG